jgi:hypothetical protein
VPLKMARNSHISSIFAGALALMSENYEGSDRNFSFIFIFLTPSWDPPLFYSLFKFHNTNISKALIHRTWSLQSTVYSPLAQFKPRNTSPA